MMDEYVYYLVQQQQAGERRDAAVAARCEEYCLAEEERSRLGERLAALDARRTAKAEAAAAREAARQRRLSSPWRNEPATAKQIDLLAALGVHPSHRPSTKGEASDLIRIVQCHSRRDDRMVERHIGLADHAAEIGGLYGSVVEESIDREEQYWQQAAWWIRPVRGVADGHQREEER